MTAVTHSLASSPAPASATDDGLSPPTLSQLFTGFLLLGLMGFGGVLPLARRSLVEERRWLGPEEFVEMLGLCQFLPGGNIINMSVAIGFRFHGIAGAVTSLVALIAAPTLVVVSLGAIYDRFQDDPLVRRLFLGLAAAAAGLLITLMLKIVLPLRGNPLGMTIFAFTVIAIGVLKLPLLPTMLVLAPISILATWLVQRAASTRTGATS